MNTSCMPVVDAELRSDDRTVAGFRAKSHIKSWASTELFGGTRELLIIHADSEYRLRLTSQGKLVLTK